MKKWKRGLWTCVALLGLEAASLAVSLAGARARYEASTALGGSAPFRVFALPVYLCHGALGLLLVGAGAYCAWRARQASQGK